MQDEQTSAEVKSVRRALQIIERIREQDGARISELAEDLQLSKSSIHAHVSTLTSTGYLVKEGDMYQIGTRFLRLGEYSRKRKVEYRMAEELVEELASNTNERAQFVIEEGGRGVFLYRASGEHAVETDSETGKRMSLHSTAAGKAILAHMRNDELQDIIETWGLPEITPNTITDEEELREELNQIRERGHAYNKEENIEGLRAVGVPVKVRDDEVIGALSVSGPTHRMKGDWLTQDIPDLLLGTANELELNIKYA